MITISSQYIREYFDLPRQIPDSWLPGFDALCAEKVFVRMCPTLTVNFGSKTIYMLYPNDPGPDIKLRLGQGAFTECPQ